MDYDKNSFLAGLATGIKLRGWIGGKKIENDDLRPAQIPYDLFYQTTSFNITLPSGETAMVNRIGVRLIYNEEAIISKCAVGSVKVESYEGNQLIDRWEIFAAAIKGIGLTSVAWNTCLWYGDKLVSEGDNYFSSVNVDIENGVTAGRKQSKFALLQDDKGVWSLGGEYGLIGLNGMEGTNLFSYTGTATKYIKILDTSGSRIDLTALKAYMNEL